jgi:NAD(P)-binding Rossmann-like domain
VRLTPFVTRLDNGVAQSVRGTSKLSPRCTFVITRSTVDGLSRDAYGAIVVGGFCGAVAACRLAQAGVDVAVIERGARFPLGSFPRRMVGRDESLLWQHGGAYDIKPLNDLGSNGDAPRPNPAYDDPGI